LQTVNRDIIRAIVEKTKAREEAGLHTLTGHIYAHALDGRELSHRKQLLIKKQAEAYAPHYEKLQKCNQEADTLAKKLTDQPPRQPFATRTRDVAANPPEHTDDYYVTAVNAQGDRYIVQSSRHALIKDNTQQRIIKKHLSDDYVPTDNTARSKAFARIHLPYVSADLSVASRRSPNHKDQEASATVHGLRMHVLQTAVKGHSKSNWLRDTDPYKNYFRALYPNPHCHFCQSAQPPVRVEEHTAHILTCPNHTDKEAICENLWNQIHEIIIAELSKQKGDQTPSPQIDQVPASDRHRLIPPFALPSQKARRLHIDPSVTSPAQGTIPHLKALANFPDDLAREGYIPTALSRALGEIGIPSEKRKKLANQIACLIHRAIHEIWTTRTRHLHRTRKQRALYNKHVYGRALDERPGSPDPLSPHSPRQEPTPPSPHIVYSPAARHQDMAPAVEHSWQSPEDDDDAAAVPAPESYSPPIAHSSHRTEGPTPTHFRTPPVSPWKAGRRWSVSPRRRSPNPSDEAPDDSQPPRIYTPMRPGPTLIPLGPPRTWPTPDIHSLTPCPSANSPPHGPGPPSPPSPPEWLEWGEMEGDE
jgi:hypothetical protein